jgi:DNA-binding winged helix-turn-helix (wHTH) protein/tetratricopeptide (TPR) repeat protein
MPPLPLEEKRFRLADLTVDLDEFTVRRDDGRAIELPRLSFDLLVALARRAPAVVPAEELIATVWDGLAVSDETLTQRVALLRRALGDPAKSPRYLRAVRGRGYQLIPPVAAAPRPHQNEDRNADENEGAGRPVPADAMAGPVPAGATAGPVPAGATAGPVPAGATAGPVPEGGALPGPMPAGALPDPVLAGALPDPVLAGALPGLVLAGASPGPVCPVPAGPAEPGARPGAVRTAALVAFAVLSAAVVVLLLVTFARRGSDRERRGQAEPAAAAPRPTPAPPGAADAAAAVATRAATVPELLRRADAYLGQHQEANNELAIELYRRALQIEAQNPPALAGLSLALSQRATKFNRHDDGGQALALAQRAVALDPRLGRAYRALGLARDSRGELRAAIAAYLRAANLEPQPAAALASAANLLQVEGHLAAALATDLRAARESAGDPPIYLEVQVGGTLAALGFEPAATVWFDRALDLRPDNVFAAAAYAAARLSQGRLREADAIAARAIARGIRRPELADVRGTVALLAGDTAQAKAFFAQALAVSPHDLRAETRLRILALQETHGPQLLGPVTDLAAELRRGHAAGDEWPDSGLDEALLDTAAGASGAALQALDAAIALGYRDAGWLELDPMLAPLRRDARFGERLARIRRLVDGERQGVLAAPWLPPGLLAGSAARM